ncbi:MAG: thioredoxin family protein [Planctomycetes bacterium]|nr:thioredoxin family protein [Planctomycetota bacterium]
MKPILYTLSSLLLALPAQAQEETTTNNWYDDFDLAVAAAKDQGKDLLVDFTGSDWCGWCIRLDEEVFEHEAFLTPAMDKFVLVKLDFPQGEEAKAKVPNPERNDELNQEYAVQGFPTILLMDAAGEVYAQTGYQEGGPEAYITHMKEISEVGKKSLARAKRLVTAFDSAENDEAKVMIIERAIQALARMESGSVGTSTIGGVVRHGLTMGGEDLAMSSLMALLDAGIMDDEIKGFAKKMDPKNEQGILEKIVQAQCAAVGSLEDVKGAVEAILELDTLGGPKDRSIAAELYTNGAFWAHRFTEQPDVAKKFAQKAKLLADKEDARLQGMLDEILNG